MTEEFFLVLFTLFMSLIIGSFSFFLANEFRKSRKDFGDGDVSDWTVMLVFSLAYFLIGLLCLILGLFCLITLVVE